MSTPPTNTDPVTFTGATAPRLEPISIPATAAPLHLTPSAPAAHAGNFDAHGVSAGSTGSLARHAPPTEPQPMLTIRVRAIYAVDEGVAPAWSLAHVQTVVAALVEAANRDLVGTGFRFACYVSHDVEIRHDTPLHGLRRDFPLSAANAAALASGTFDQAAGQAVLDSAHGLAIQHRNQVARERPNTMLWLISRGDRWDLLRDATDNFIGWKLVEDRGGSYSGGPHHYVALHDGFLTSASGAAADASRAVHECGHYLGLGHTHREDDHLHDPANITGALETDMPAVRLAAWQRAAASWLASRVPANATPADALAVYDADRGNVLDTPADPGAGILALANQVAGFGFNSTGSLRDLALTVRGVSGPVTFTPLRDNPMGYYLDAGGSTPMRFTRGQINVMRDLLRNGARRPLVAAQLGDTATPDLRVCGVWSPGTFNQRLTWNNDLAAHQTEHNAMRAGGMVLVAQHTYTHNGAVRFDGIWNLGNRPQEVVWGFTAPDLQVDAGVRAARGMLPVHVQGYEHLNHGVRYNTVYEPGTGTSELCVGVTQDQLAAAGREWSARGLRMSCLTACVDAAGTARYSTVFRIGPTAQAWVLGWTLDDIAAEYGRRWNVGWRIRHMAVVKLAAGHRWSAIFEPDTTGQLVHWADVRERIGEVYDEMWASDYRLRSMCVVPA